MNKKLAMLLFAIGVGAASVSVSATASTGSCIQACVGFYKACVAAGQSDECVQDLYDCEDQC